MATWATNPPAKNGTQRRKWNLDDRTSLNNLKYHIAEEGCSEVQYDLAKQLLEKPSEPEEVNASEKAVHWLVCAAQQGHEDAMTLLRQCYDDGCGITPENESEVRCCLSMTPGERAARKAARELFACLSNGGEHITPKQLERKMRKIYNLQKKRRRRGQPESTSEEDTEEEEQSNSSKQQAVGNGHMHPSHRLRPKLNTEESQEERITEENLVSAAVNYAAGRMPAVNNALTLSVPHPSSLDHLPCFHRLLFHPIIFLTLLYHRLINFISSVPVAVPHSVRLAIIFVCYWVISSGNVSTFVPIYFYYACLAVMIWSTCKMLKAKHEFIDFRIWSGLFLSYGDHNIEADTSEQRFLKNNMRPYFYFFCAFVGSLLVYPLLPSDWLLHSEITIISCVFGFITLIAFMNSTGQGFPDWTVLISFGVNVLAKYPYEMDDVVATGWRFLDLKVPTFCSFVIGNGIEFCLNCRTALYLLIPGFLVHLAMRSHWHGTYKHLIPHCVTLSWLQLCITSSQSATMFGVIRATLGLAGVLLYLPLFGLLTLLIPVFAAIDWMGFTDASLRWGGTVVIGSVVLLVSCYFANNRHTQKYLTVLQVFIFIMAASVLTFPHMASNFKDSTHFSHSGPVIDSRASDNHLHPDDLSWQHFYEYCRQPAWDHNNKIRAQLRCSHLEGMKVSWEGTVSEVRISRVSNSFSEYIAKYLPAWLADQIRCIYGRRILDDVECDLETAPLCKDLRHILHNNQMDGNCHLHNWNSYEYEVIVRISTGLLSKSTDLVLQASDSFGNFTFKLASGDHVHFRGTLSNSRVLESGIREDFVLGSHYPHVQLSAIECLQCNDSDIPPVRLERPGKSHVNARLRDLIRGIKYLLNVLLNPLITFK